MKFFNRIVKAFSVFLASALIVSIGTQIFASDANSKTEVTDQESRTMAVPEAPALRYRSAVAEIRLYNKSVSILSATCGYGDYTVFKELTFPETYMIENNGTRVCSIEPCSDLEFLIHDFVTDMRTYRVFRQERADGVLVYIMTDISNSTEICRLEKQPCDIWEIYLSNGEHFIVSSMNPELLVMGDSDMPDRASLRCNCGGTILDVIVLVMGTILK